MTASYAAGMRGAIVHETIPSLDGVPVAFEARGAGTTALVFVHGWSCDRRYWERQIAAFADRHRVVAIDLAGHGESGTGRADWTMPAFGADVAAVCDHLGLDDLVLVGHSMGGDVIVEAARRLRGRVRGLVWLDTYRSLGGPRATAEEFDAFVAPFVTDFPAAARAFVRTMFRDGIDPELVEWVVEDMASAPPDIAVGSMRHAMTFEPQACAGLLELELPAVAINPDDRPTDAGSLRRHGMETIVMENSSHFLHLEDPARFNRLLEEALASFAR